MRLGVFFHTCLVLAAFVGPASALDSFNPYRVGVDAAHGVYLGKGVVVTAGHVVSGEPHVNIAGKQIPAKIIKRGEGDVDLGVLVIDDHLPELTRLGRVSLCQDPPQYGDPVLVVGVAAPRLFQSYILNPSRVPGTIPSKYEKFLIRFIPEGASGSGVFHPKTRCLLGIITHKLSVTSAIQVNGQPRNEIHDVANYFIPAAEIARVIPPELRD